MMAPQCPRCLIYFTEENGRIVEDQRAIPFGTARFEMPVPETYRMPNMCCGCGGEPSTTSGVSAPYITQRGVIMSTETTYWVSVPFCGQCDSSRGSRAELVREYGVMLLKVSSLPFQREFLRLNRLGRFR